MRYPLGEQNFDRIIESGFIYVDKTIFIPTLLQNNYYFLSRPRRFGKSLFLSTLEQFFLGNRQLFKGLAVYDIPWEWHEYPIIRIDLSSGSFSEPEGLTERLNRILDRVSERYDVQIQTGSPGSRFDSLINNLYKKFERKVVILVDEYEKPLLDTLYEDHHTLYVNQLRDFYSVLKENSKIIEFLFITGVTRFGHLNIFSGLNNLTDISLNDRFAAICGITQEELTQYFADGILNLAKAKNISYDEAVEKLKNFYDGYHFSGAGVDIYNPYSVMECLYTGRFTNKWFQSGSSTFLIKRLRENQFDLTGLDGITATEETLLGVDSSLNTSVTLLYQSGYLTIKSFDEEHGIYYLGIPNVEVKKALFNAIVPFYIGKGVEIQPSDYIRISEWLSRGEVMEMLNWLKQLLAKVTYDVKLLPLKEQLQQESDFQFIVFAVLSLSCGVNNVELEQTTSNGRMDLTVTTPKYIYIFEFKMDGDAKQALQQINEKGYTLRWSSDSRKIIKVGVSFSSSLRNISDIAIDE